MHTKAFINHHRNAVISAHNFVAVYISENHSTFMDSKDSDDPNNIASIRSFQGCLQI